MGNRKNLAILLSALVMAGAGLSGCDENNFTIPDQGGTSDPSDPGSVKVPDSFKGLTEYAKEVKSASSECKKEDCMTNSACTSGKEYAACVCAQGGTACQEYDFCNNIGKCKYTCGQELKDPDLPKTCSWTVCAGSDACGGGGEVCVASALPADGDWDGDGITNGTEREHAAEGLDPCNPDVDNDGVRDGDEDFNHNGIYEPELGETNFNDPDSKLDANSPDGKLSAAACRDEFFKAAGSTATLELYQVAKSTGITYSPAGEILNTINVLRFETDKVVGFFGSKSTEIGSIEQLMGSILEPGTFDKASSQPNNSVPEATWLENGVYDKKLQVVPDFGIDRFKYTIRTNGKSLQEISELFAKQFEGDASSGGKYVGTAINCDSATLYIARSKYKFTRVYMGAFTCDADANKALLDDVYSGTLVAPTAKVAEGDASYNTNGYSAYERFMCQIEDYGNSSGKVDFLWVIDNSGSMADELDNVSATVDMFATAMKDYGIEYRAGVTTTDAFLLDEDPTAFVAYDPNSYEVNLKSAYLNGLGFRQLINTTGKKYRGLLDLVKGGKVQNNPQKVFMQEVTSNDKCLSRTPQKKNICGFGYEDGIKSGLFTLSRIGVDVSASQAAEQFNAYDSAHWDELVKIKNGTVFDGTDSAQVSLSPSENALLYVIWVSDEESRQFKEEQDFSDTKDAAPKDSPNHNAKGKICKTGYKLDNGTMGSGPMADGADKSVCNPAMKETLEAKIASGELKADSTMEEIEAAYPEYANLLKYYIKQYQSFAQGREIVGFALVGDSGLKNNESCAELAECPNEAQNCLNWKEVGTAKYCVECNVPWDYGSASAKYGANYGLSYIHLARFLSSYYPDAPNKATKPGGYGSICSEKYELTIKTIAEDIVGRLGSHPLKGYPISSSIRVYVVRGQGEATELKRDADTNGWSYDPYVNSITFKGVSNVSVSDRIVIAYAIWNKVDG